MIHTTIRKAIAKIPAPGEAHNENIMAHAINKSWAPLNAAASTEQAHALIAAHETAQLINGLPWTAFISQVAPAMLPLKNQINNAVEHSMNGFKGVVSGLSWSNQDAVSIKYAQQEGAQMIKALTDTQRKSIQTVMSQAVSGRYTVDQAAAAIRGSIGLHPQWALAVDNYRMKQVNELAKTMTQAQAEKIAGHRADIYQSRLITKRSMNIARTEIQTAQNLGRYATFAQMISYGYLPKTSQKEWVAGSGACPICSALAGSTAQWDQAFDGGWIMPPAHVNCRCTAVLLPTPTNNPMLNAQPINWTNPIGNLNPETLAPNLFTGTADSYTEDAATSNALADTLNIGTLDVGTAGTAATYTDSQPQAETAAPAENEIHIPPAAPEPLPTPKTTPKKLPTVQETRGTDENKETAQIFHDAYKPPTREQRAAIKDYQGSGYRDMNRTLRGTLREPLSPTGAARVEKQNTDLTNLINKQKPLNQDVTLYRGMSSSHVNPNHLNVGDTIRDQGFTSAAINYRDAYSFISGQNAFMFQIDVPKGTRLLPVNPASARSEQILDYESEILFPPGSQLTITGKRAETFQGRTFTYITAKVTP